MSNNNVCYHCTYRWQSRIKKPKKCPKCGTRFKYLPCGRKSKSTRASRHGHKKQEV